MRRKPVLVIQFLSLLLVSLVFLQSCRCGGADRIYSNYGIDMVTADSVNMQIDTDPLLTINILTSSRKGDRKCYYKNLVTKTENIIPESSVNIYCNKDIKLKTGIIPAYSNLLNYGDNLRIVKYNSMNSKSFGGCSIYPSYPDSSFEKGKYEFFVTAIGGETTFTDSGTTILY